MERPSSISKIERISQRESSLLGKNIKRLRVERGWRNRDIICRLQLRGIDIGSSTYSKVESGKTNPTVTMIMALAEIYQCEYKEFFKE